MQKELPLQLYLQVFHCQFHHVLWVSHNSTGNYNRFSLPIKHYISLCYILCKTVSNATYRPKYVSIKITFRSLPSVPVHKADQLLAADRGMQRCHVLSSPSLMLVFLLQIDNKRKKVEEIQAYNSSLLGNILPDHVINHFLSPDVNPLVSIVTILYASPIPIITTSLLRPLFCSTTGAVLRLPLRGWRDVRLHSRVLRILRRG